MWWAIVGWVWMGGRLCGKLGETVCGTRMGTQHAIVLFVGRARCFRDEGNTLQKPRSRCMWFLHIDVGVFEAQSIDGTEPLLLDEMRRYEPELPLPNPLHKQVPHQASRHVHT